MGTGVDGAGRLAILHPLSLLCIQELPVCLNASHTGFSGVFAKHMWKRKMKVVVVAHLEFSEELWFELILPWWAEHGYLHSPG